MWIKELETSEIQLALPAEFGLYTLQDKHIKGVIKTVKAAKQKMYEKKTALNGSLYNTVFQLEYHKYVLLVRPHENFIELIDILNKGNYNPNNNFHPQIL